MNSIKINTTVDLNSKMVVYRMQFPNGKNYIGQTINLLRVRLQNHLQLVNKSTYPLYKAMRKYKEFNLYIEARASNIDDLNTLEMFYIAHYDCIVDRKKGYNCDTGGDNSICSLQKRKNISLGQKARPKIIRKYKMSEETKRKIGLANKGKIPWIKGKHRSEETKAKLRITSSGKKYMLGKHHTEETKQRLREVNLGKKHSQETKDKLSRKLKGKKCPMEGKHHSEETKEKIRLFNIGKKHSEETKLKMSEKQSLRKHRLPHTEETKEKLRIANLGNKLSDETKLKVSLSLKKFWADKKKYASNFENEPED